MGEDTPSPFSFPLALPFIKRVHAMLQITHWVISIRSVELLKWRQIQTFHLEIHEIPGAKSNGTKIASMRVTVTI